MKGSILLELRCANCDTYLLNYQKQGKGNLRVLHLERIIEASFKALYALNKELKCPSCQSRLGIYDEKLNAYRMGRSSARQRLIY